MKIAVLNGSPKGDYSITLHTLLYLRELYPEEELTVLNVGQRIKAYERDMSEAVSVLSEADAVIFSYPVYTFLAPSQLHRFIELIKLSGIDLSGKYATQITTSKHFYDVTAHRYIEENALDLGMRYIDGLSADMEDLLTERGRKEARDFFDRFLWSVREGIWRERTGSVAEFIPVAATALPEPQEGERRGDVVIITDATGGDGNLSSMIARLRSRLNYGTRVVNISDYPLSGGCLGCFRCAVSERCVYKDGFDSFLRESIQSADAIVYAFTVSDHSMGSRFKMYDDRNFCNGHRTVTVGMPVGYLVSGRYSEEENLKTLIAARADTGGNILAGVASDECDPDGEIDRLAKSLSFALEHRISAPRSFYGVGGMKIFRDLIYEMRGMMRADHKFYKKQGIYDFPWRHRVRSLKMYLVGMLLSSPKVLAKMGNAMNEGMVAPYRRLLSGEVRRREEKQGK